MATNRIEKIQEGIYLLLQASLVVSIIQEIFFQRWFLCFVTVLILLLTFIPKIIERNIHIYLPVEFELVVVFFIYASLYLGEIQDFYNRFHWWDAALHGISGIVLGFVGFMLIYIFNSERKIKTSPIFIAIFSCTFAIAIGAVWEIFEFGMDSFFGLNMQKSGLVDTMFDLILDSVGALVVAVLGYFYVRDGDSLFFDRFLRAFLQENGPLAGEN